MNYTLRLATLAVLLLPPACGPRDDAYPALLPTAQILAEPILPDHAVPAARAPDAVDAEAASRAEALRRRAEALRGPVIDPATRARLAGSAS